MSLGAVAAFHVVTLAAIAAIAITGAFTGSAPPMGMPSALGGGHPVRLGGIANDSVIGNFSGALQRLVSLVSVAGGALLALVWARVAISWFSNDVTKKVQAKDRARDALVGSLVFVAALSGLVWGLAQWVITGG